jgi:ADP-ribose pyrophosphatase YjhB (NUDIX family)
LFPAWNMLSSSSASASVPYPPRAGAMAVVTLLPVQEPNNSNSNNNNTYHYLLIQCANLPKKGKWALPGGKIHVGETTSEAAQQELTKETLIVANKWQWYPHPFLMTKVVFQNNDGDNKYAFHYLIAHCFAQVQNKLLPKVVMMPSDNALDAQEWWTLEEISQHNDSISQEGVVVSHSMCQRIASKGCAVC